MTAGTPVCAHAHVLVSLSVGSVRPLRGSEVEVTPGGCGVSPGETVLGADPKVGKDLVSSRNWRKGKNPERDKCALPQEAGEVSRGQTPGAL